MKFAEGFRSAVPPPLQLDAINWCIDACMRSFTWTETTKELLRSYAGYLLFKSCMSDMRTGIVVAGFGKLDLCPSLDNIEMDGVIGGRFKKDVKPYVDIGRHQTEADIFGFAQDDMVKSFLNGIDPVFEDFVNSSITSAIFQSSDMLLTSLVNDNDQRKNLQSGLAPELQKISDGVKNELAAYVDKYSSKPIRDMIRSMPKQELTSLASSLIEITSLKRKVTREQETVGGPVDVAIISKAEGFVWVKRKHYFPPELNRRFFVRHFGGDSHVGT